MVKMTMVLVGVGFLLIGCGIPEEQYNATLDELKKAKADAAADRKACDEAKADLEGKNKTLGDENRVMKSKLVALGQDLSKLNVNIGEKEKQIADLLKAQEQARQRAAMFKDLLAKFKQMIDSGKLKVEIRKGRMIVKMSDKILFDAGKDDLKKEGQLALGEVTKILAGIADRAFQVAGHTDNVPIKSRKFKSNWELSTARAVNVVRFMIENGMKADRISAAGYGEFDPVGNNAADDGRQQNRRIEITLMPSIEELPKIGE